MTTETNTKLFTIKPIGSKGLGVVSSDFISKGTLILCEPPLFTIPIDTLPTESLIQEALSTKSTTEHTEYNKLFNATATSKPNEPLTGIFQSNALPCGDNDVNLESQPASEQGIFLVGSRFNSSCTSNVNAYWNPDSEEMEFRVMRDIKPEEELSIAYCDILKAREERRKFLKEKWLFDCHCDGCEFKILKDDDAPVEQFNEEEAVKMSDMRRKSVGGLLGTVAFGYTVDSTKLALRLLKKEGILNFQETLCYDAYQLSTAEDQQHPLEALAWARKAWKASCILTGPESSNSQRLLNCYEGAKVQNQDGLPWGEDQDSDVLEELVDSDDDGYYTD